MTVRIKCNKIIYENHSMTHFASVLPRIKKNHVSLKMNQVGIEKSTTGATSFIYSSSIQNRNYSNSDRPRSLQQLIKIKTLGKNGQKRIRKKYDTHSFMQLINHQEEIQVKKPTAYSKLGSNVQIHAIIFQ